MNKTIQTLSEWVHGDKGRRLIVWLGIIGMGLILLSQFWPETPQTPSVSADLTYASLLEDRLRELVSGVDGVGDCRIMVTLESGTEYIYSDKQTLLTELVPKVRGVVIVCDGGEDETVRSRVVEVITTALNISKRKVCVTKSSA